MTLFLCPLVILKSKSKVFSAFKCENASGRDSEFFTFRIVVVVV